MNRQSKCDILTSNDTCGEMAKHDRMLDLCLRLMSGEIISKSEEAMKNNVSERTIQRDLDDLRAFFDEKSQRTGENRSLCYDHHLRGYRIMQENQNAFSDGETLAVSKVLLESRAFTREEITDILTKLMKNCVPRQNADRVKTLISNELHYYLPTQNSSPSMDKIWQIGVAINETRFLEIQYTRQNGDLSQKEIEPVAIMFSEFYFYLLAYDRSVTEKKDFNEKAIFGGVQSVARAPDDFFNDFSLLIIDECHRVAEEGATQYQDVIKKLRERNPNLYVLGLTAPPYRLGLGWIYEFSTEGELKTEK